MTYGTAGHIRALSSYRDDSMERQMGIPVEQISEDDVIIHHQQMNREQHLDDMRPSSFSEYLRLMDEKPANPQERHRAAIQTLSELAERAKRAPRDG